MAVTVLFFQMPMIRIKKRNITMWSEVAMARTISECISGRINLATAAKELAVPRNSLRRKAAENEKFTEHILNYKLTRYQIRC
jgi:hypothetical protein